MRLHLSLSGHLFSCVFIATFILLQDFSLAQEACIGKDDNPKNDFYVKQMSEQIDFVNNAGFRLPELKFRNQQIDSRTAILTKSIPRLELLLQTEIVEAQADYDRKKSFFDTLVAQQELQKIQELAAWDITDRAQRETHLRTLNEKNLQFFRKQKAKVDRQESEALSRAALKLQEQISKLNSDFRNNFENDKKNKIVTKETIELNRTYRNARLKELQDNHAQDIDEIKDEHNKIRKSIAETESAAIRSFEGALADLEQTKTDREVDIARLIDERKQKNSSILDVNKTRHQRSLRRIKYYINDLKAELTELKSEKEKNQQTIATIQDRLQDLKFINAWWNEQGRENATRTNMDGRVCVDCSTKPINNKIEPPLISNDCVDTAKFRRADTEEYKCEKSSSAGTTTKNLCIPQKMSDYTQWSLNNALKCLSPINDPIDINLMHEKLHNESTMRPVYAYNGGQGLWQTTTIAQQEALGVSVNRETGAVYRSTGRKLLVDGMQKNSAACSMYKGLIDYSTESAYDKLDIEISAINRALNTKGTSASTQKKLRDVRKEKEAAQQKLMSNNGKITKPLFEPGLENVCQFISLEEGLHRNILSGMGLFLYLRKMADEDLRDILKGNPILNNTTEYRKIRDLTAIAYFGREGRNDNKADGNVGILSRLRARKTEINRRLNAKNKSPSDEFRDLLTDVSAYLKDIQRAKNDLYKDLGTKDLECTQK